VPLKREGREKGEKGVNREREQRTIFLARCPPRIRAATGVRRRVSPTWPCLIQREAFDTVSCRCPPRLRVRVRFGSGKRRPTTVSEHHRWE